MECYCPYYTNKDKSHTLISFWSIPPVLFPCLSLSCYFLMWNQNARFKCLKYFQSLINWHLQMILIVPGYCKYYSIICHQGLILNLFQTQNRSIQSRWNSLVRCSQATLVMPNSASVMWENFKQKCTWIVKEQCWISPVTSSAK